MKYIENLAKAGMKHPIIDSSDDEETSIQKSNEGLIFKNKEREELEEIFERDDKYFKDFF